MAIKHISHQTRKGLHKGTVKTDPHKFCHLKLNSNVTAIFKIYQKHLFLYDKTEK